MRHLPSLLLALSLAACAPAKSGSGGPDAGIPDLPDEDGDGIADEHEGRPGEDTDGDGTPDYLDDDSDGDGVPDYREAGDDLSGTPPIDSDSDGAPDFRDTDADDNGRADGIDGGADTDNDGAADFQDLDDDGDGLNDELELGDPASPADSDGDGDPDFRDVDSDNDTISDLHEGTGDPDGDGKGNFVDLDSDGDCLVDSVEAGDDQPATLPIDSDADSQRDFLDLDADNDGLLDELEDPNCNGLLDAGESSTTDGDTDNDGVTDLVEEAAGTDPANPADNPQANGDFVFLVPYQDPPSPDEDTLDFSTDITQADVAFVMDTTGSMGQEIGNLKSSISSLISQVRGLIPNTGFAVTGYEDFPTDPFGWAGDQPFYRHHRVMTTNTGTGLTSIQNAVNLYDLGNGNDGPESNWEALYQVASGAGVSVGGAAVAAFNPATAYPTAPPAGEQLGTIGGAGFRSGSLPIVILITDACGHNSAIGYGYNFGGAASRASAESALLGISARVIAVVSSPQTGGCNGDDARVDALHVVNTTNAIVPPDAWGPAGVRPASCAVGTCCTGINGAGEAASAGMCPLLFRLDGNTGAGLGSAAATAVKVLAQYAEYDIGGRAQDDPVDAVDAVAAFVSRVEANPNGGGSCANIPAVDTNADSFIDTFRDVNPGTTVCFDVIPKMNTTVPATTMPQMFKATVLVEGDQVTTLDTRDVFFLVPPEIPDVPIE